MYHIRQSVSLILAFILIIILTSCSSGFDPIEFNADVDLPDEYKYEVKMGCFCTSAYVGPHKFHIKGNQIIGYELLAEDVPEESQISPTQFTIDELVLITNSMSDQNPVERRIEPHPMYNFPISVYIDIDTRIADEEWGYEITNFEAID